MNFKFSTFIKRRAHARLRRAMRGYRILKSACCPERIAHAKETLTNTPVFASQRALKNTLGFEGAKFELVVRQFLLVRLVGAGLAPALLESIGAHDRPVVYPLPQTWRQALHAQGFNISQKKSAWLWKGFITLHLLHGGLILAKLACQNFRAVFRCRESRLGNYAFFDTLNEGNLPAIDRPVGGYDVVSWYLRWPSGIKNLDSVRHTVTTAADRESACGTPIGAIATPLVPLESIGGAIRFVSWGFTHLLTSLIGVLFFQRWWYAVMFSETAKAALIRLQDPALLARDYLFHNSNWIYRPLWTYYAENKGARVFFYFYSTNIEKFKRASTYASTPFGWQIMTWSHYLVWDRYQCEFIQRAVGSDARIDVVGPVPFHAEKSLDLELNPLSIAVFDIQPMRNVTYQMLGIDMEYYVPRHANSFLVDIQHATASAGYTMALKRKRNVGHRLHPSYEHTLTLLIKADNYLEVDPDVSATELIKKCQAVISMPFTSTALLGRHQGLPSVYYDPLGICQKNDRAAHGIPILSGKAELSAWLKSLTACNS